MLHDTQHQPGPEDKDNQMRPAGAVKDSLVMKDIAIERNGMKGIAVCSRESVLEAAVENDNHLSAAIDLTVEPVVGEVQRESLVESAEGLYERDPDDGCRVDAVDWPGGNAVEGGFDATMHSHGKPSRHYMFSSHDNVRRVGDNTRISTMLLNCSRKPIEVFGGEGRVLIEEKKPLDATLLCNDECEVIGRNESAIGRIVGVCHGDQIFDGMFPTLRGGAVVVDKKIDVQTHGLNLIEEAVDRL